jgi:predicted ATP-grasp superfamily ATP-dependent carboligase
MSQVKNILLTAGRSPLVLDLARQLHAAGHRVFVSETMKLHVCLFSNAVCRSFVVPSPRFHPGNFVKTLVKIVEEEKIDLVIPIYEEIVYISKAIHQFPKECKIFCPPFEVLNELHNKWLFYSKQLSLGIEAPKTFLIRSFEDLKKLDFSTSYALKECYSRASLNLKKISSQQSLPDIQIQSQNPWIAQEWLEGNKFCTYSICNQGSLLAHAAYPVRYAINGNSCITFKAIDHPAIYRWIKNFASLLNFSGQIAFDFIELPNKKLFAIECNPRATSGIHLFCEKDQIDKAFLNATPSPIFPQLGCSKQIAAGMLMYGWKKSSYGGNSFRKFFKELFSVKDVVFSFRDIKPFLLEPLVFTGIWLNSKKKRLSIPATFTFDYEWNGE